MRTIQTFQNQEHQRGAALLTLMIILLLVGGTGAYLVHDAKQQAFAVTRVRDYLKAQAYAEGGANAAYSLLKTNFAIRTDASRFPLTPYGDGTYDVTVTSVDSNLASITCVGQRGNATVSVMIDLQNFPAGATSGGTGGTNAAPVGAYANAMHSGGNMAMSGNSTISTGNGKVHSNGALAMSGNQKITTPLLSSVGPMTMSGNSTITGDTVAPSYSISGNAKITGTKTVDTVDPIATPDIDLTPYYNYALANGEVITGNKTYNGNTALAPVGGVLWVEGTLTISGNVTVQGCLIATKSITLSGNGAQTKVDDLPAIISRDGDISISGNSTYHGLIYAKTGAYKGSGNGTITGSIIVNGTFATSGNFKALVYENSTPPSGGPGATTSEETSDRVRVIAWQK